MTIKDLSYFLQVCRSGSINGAARSLYISAQGLSRILKNLEDELGYPIFERTKSGVTPTEDGRILERYAREILAKAEQMQKEIQRRHDAQQGLVRLAAAYGLIGFFGPESLLTFRRENPDLTLEVAEYTDSKVAEAVWYRQADWGLINLPVEESRYQVTPLGAIQLYLLVNRDNPLAQAQALDIAQLRGQPIAIQNQEFNLHQLIQRKCHAAGFTPEIVFESNGICMCNQLCLQNATVSIVPAHTMRNLHSEKTRLIPFRDPEMQLQCALIRRRDTPLTLEMARLQQFFETAQRPIP